jgi:hypothetical protein
MCRFCLKKRYKRRERFCRYIGGDWTFTYLLGRKKKIFMKLTLIWQSEKLDKMNGVLSVFSFSVEWAAFDALRDCTSSKLQLLHWVPEQRVWNKKLSLAFVLPWRPCRQASPQKHACGTRLFANRPMIRNWTKNSLNIFTFLNRFFSILNSIKKGTGQHTYLVL